MKSTASRAPGSRVVLEVEVPPEEMAPDIQDAYRRLARQVRIPGFRPGRAPAAIVERVVGRERVLREALDRVVTRAYQSAVTEQNIKPVSQPEVDVTSFDDGQALRFQATVHVRPEVALGDYGAVRFPLEVAPVQAEDVAGALEDLRRSRGTWVPVEGEPAAEGDLVMLRVIGKVDDGRPIEEQRVEGVVGRGMLRGEVDAAVRGLKANESVEVDLQFPAEDAQRDLAGKSARVTATLLELKRQELAPLDDAFALEVSGRKTLEELREDLGNRLRAAAARQADQALADKALGAAVDAAQVEVSEVLVDRAVDNQVAELQQRLSANGVPLAAHLSARGQTLDELRAELRPAGEARVRRELVVDALAEHAGLVPSTQDMEDEIARLAAGSGVPTASFRKLALRPDNWGTIRYALSQQRVLRMMHEIALGVPVEEARATALRSSSEPDREGEAGPEVTLAGLTEATAQAADVDAGPPEAGPADEGDARA